MTRAAWDQSDRDSVRSYIGDGHAVFTDDDIDRTAREWLRAGQRPSSRQVGERLLDSYYGRPR
jgi:hypothetical protein